MPFGSILGPFWNPPWPILGQFGSFSVLFCSYIASFASLFFASCFLVFVVDAVGDVGVVVGGVGVGYALAVLAVLAVLAYWRCWRCWR